MSDPKNHHWLPRFLLREWATGPDKKVMCFYRPHSRVVSSRQGTKKIGSTEWLYTASWAGYTEPSFFETSFMTKAIDTPAARIHRRMLAGETEALGFAERELWSYFMLLLTQRHPDAIQPKQEAEEERWKKTYVDILIGQTPTGYARPLDRASAEAFYDQHMAGSGRDLVLQALGSFPRKSQFFSHLMSLEWRVLRLNRAPTHFLLADNPITMWGDGSIKRVWMPLAPDALFVAGDHNYFAGTSVLREEFRGILPLDVMHYQCKRARGFVIGRDQGAEKNQALVAVVETYLRERG